MKRMKCGGEAVVVFDGYSYCQECYEMIKIAKEEEVRKKYLARKIAAAISCGAAGWLFGTSIAIPFAGFKPFNFWNLVICAPILLIAGLYALRS